MFILTHSSISFCIWLIRFSICSFDGEQITSGESCACAGLLDEIAPLFGGKVTPRRRERCIDCGFQIWDCGFRGCQGGKVCLLSAWCSSAHVFMGRNYLNTRTHEHYFFSASSNFSAREGSMPAISERMCSEEGRGSAHSHSILSQKPGSARLSNFPFTPPIASW